MKLERAIAASVLVSAFAAPVAAGTFEDAVDAHARGDHAKALRLIRPLANDGDATAQFNLGVMYAEGRSVPQDYVHAHMWFSLAAAQGEQRAVKTPEMAERRMTPAQIAEAQKLARDWKPATQPTPH
jgi:uncharacterized protein